MTTLTSLLNPQLALSVTLTLAHFLWQGLALGLVAFLGVAILRKASARARYAFLLLVLIAMAVCPLITMAIVSRTVDMPRMAASSTLPAGPALESPPSAAPTIEFPAPPTEAATPESTAFELPPLDPSEAFAAPLTVAAPSNSAYRTMFQIVIASVPWDRWAPYVVWAYLLGVVLMWGRLLMGIHGGHRLRKIANPVEDSQLTAALRRQAEALGLRVVPALTYCGRVGVPTVVGIFRPMILLPLSIQSGLSPAQVEYLLCHELAHIRRYDHLANLLQSAIEAFLFFHPAVLYVSRRLRIEREHCCDDIVLARGGESLCYADSLLRVAELSKGITVPGLLLSAAGKPSRLSTRIYRILNVPPPRVRLSRIGLCTLALGLGLGGIAVVQVAAAPRQDKRTLVELAPPDAASSQEKASDSFSSEPLQPAQKAASEVLPFAGVNIFSEKDPWVRKLALQQIGQTKDARYLGDLIRVLQGGSRPPGTGEDRTALQNEYRVEATAAEVLGQIGDPRAIPYLVAVLRNPVHRDAAANALRQMNREDVLPLLLVALNDDDRGMQEGVIAALGGFGDPDSIAHIFEAMADRQLLPAALEALKAPPEEAVRAEAHHHLESGDSARQAAAAALLGALGGEDPPQVLLTLLQHQDEDLRRTAIEALGNFAGPGAQEALIQALTQDPHFGNRQAAARLLQNRGYLPESPELEAAYQVALENWGFAATLGATGVAPLTAALGSNDQSVRKSAVVALGGAGPEVLEHILPLLRDEDSGIRRAAVYAVQLTANPLAVPALIECLKDTEEAVRRAAAKVLGDFKDPQAVEPLIAGLKDPETAEEAIAALGSIGDPACVPALIELIASPVTSTERAMSALRVIEKLGDADSATQLLRIAENVPESRKLGRTTLSEYLRGSAQQMQERYEVSQKDVEPGMLETSAAEPLTQEVANLIGQLSDTDPWLRKVAAQKLGALDIPGQQDSLAFHLIKCLKDEDTGVRIAAAESLAKIGAPDAIKHLVATLKDNTAEVREKVAEAVARFQQPSVMEYLKLAIADGDPNLRRGAVLALRHIATPEAIAHIIDAMDGADINVFRDITYALTQLSATDVAPPLLAAMQDRRLDVAAGAASILGEIGGEEVSQALRAVAATPDSLARLYAIKALAAVEGEELTQFLAGLLTDPAFPVREEAARALSGRFYRPETPEAQARYYIATGDWNQVLQAGQAALGPLIEAVQVRETDTPKARWLMGSAGEPRLRPGSRGGRSTLASNAAHTLGELKSIEAVEPLIQLLDSPEQTDRAEAINALLRIRDPRAVPAIAARLTDPDYSIRYSAAAALGELGDLSATVPLVEALKDPAAEVRQTVAEALGKLRAVEAIPALLQSTHDVIEDVRDQSIQALSDLGDPGAQAVLEAFSGLPPYVRRSAVYHFARSLPDTLPILIQGIQDTDDYVSATGLDQITQHLETVDAGGDLDTALSQALLECMKSDTKSTEIQSKAAYILAKSGNEAQRAAVKEWLTRTAPEVMNAPTSPVRRPVLRAPTPVGNYQGIWQLLNQ